MGFVLNIGFKYFKAIGLGRQRRRDGRHGFVVALGDLGRRSGGIRMDHRLQAQPINCLAALRQRMNMAAHSFYIVQTSADDAQQLVAYSLKMFADEMQACIRQHLVNIRDPSGDRVFDRDHGATGPAVFNRRKGIGKGPAWQGLHVRKNLAAGQVRVGPGGALECHDVGGVGGHGLQPFVPVPVIWPSSF